MVSSPFLKIGWLYLVFARPCPQYPNNAESFNGFNFLRHIIDKILRTGCLKAPQKTPQIAPPRIQSPG
jgi:hypothetical protein